VENAIGEGRLEPPRDRELEALLRGFGLIVEGQLLNAAMALFGKGERLAVYYPQCAIRMARFRGTSRLADFTDNRQYEGHAFDLLRRAEAFLLDRVPIAGRVIPGRMRREDRPAYPPRSTPEALANALCHRDYTQAGGAVSVAMYDDRLEIVNPGELHFGLTLEKLLQPHESRPWNPIIAGVFHRVGIIERWGEGTLNMAEWCREVGAPAPVHSEQAGSVIVTFFPAGPESGPGSESKQELDSLEKRVFALLTSGDLSKSELTARLGHREVAGALNRLIRRLILIRAGLIEYTIPEKPQSRLQRYRLTAAGRARVRNGT
jgi:ATP-dependent DNA helicase RecG